MLVSAIITTCRRDPEIVNTALHSVMAQTYKDLEIIVVDDSPLDFDGRDAVRRTIMDSCSTVRYISHGENRGAPAARNTGIREAKGEYVAFLDDDDEWLPEKIEEQIKGFTTEKIALVYSGFIIHDEIHHTQFISKRIYHSGKVYFDLLELNFIGSTSVPLIRKEYLEAIGGFDESLESRQDLDVYLRLAKEYEINYVPGEWVIRHWHRGKRITTVPSARLQGTMRVIEKNADALKKRPHACACLYRSLIPQYRQLGMMKDALRIWIYTAEKDPLDVTDNLKYLLLALFRSDFLPIQWYKTIRHRWL